MNEVVRLILAGATCAALGAFPARSADPEPSDPAYEVYALARVTVTAEAEAVDETALTVAVTAEQIAARNAKNVAEALAAVRGLRVSTGRKNESTVWVHGFDQSRVQVLVDGVPYYEANYGKLDLSQIPTDNVARIEVTKGVASVLGGANALGGTINIISRTAGAKPFTELLAEGGDYSTGRFVATHGARNGALSYWLNVSGQTSDGTAASGSYQPRPGVVQQKSPTKNTSAVLEDGGRRENSDASQLNAWTKIGWEPSAATAVFLNVHYFDREKGAPPATDVVQVFLKRPAFSQFSRIPTYRDLGIDLDARSRLASNFTLKAKGYWHEHVDDYESYKDQSYSEKIASSRYDDSLAGGSLLADWQPSSTSTLRASFHLKDDTHRERDDAYLPFAESGSMTGSVGLEDTLALTKALSVVAGVSYDWFRVMDAERNVTDGTTGDFVRQDSLATPSDDLVSPMAGFVWRSGSGTVVNAAVARKGRFPTLSQLFSSKSGNVGLESERSTNVTASASLPVGADARVELGGFLYDVTDMITRSGSSATNIFQNVGRVRMAGFEAVAEATLLAGLVIRADYTFVDARDASAVRVTDDVTNVPRHKAGLFVSYAVPGARTLLDLDAVWVGSMYSSLPSVSYPADPVKMVDGYFLLGAKVTQEVMPGIRLYVSGRNVLDEDYESEAGFPGVGRTFSFGASATF